MKYISIIILVLVIGAFATHTYSKKEYADVYIKGYEAGYDRAIDTFTAIVNRQLASDTNTVSAVYLIKKDTFRFYLSHKNKK